MLERFRHAKAAEIADLKERAARGAMPPLFTGRRLPFAASLAQGGAPAVIAEYKRASPSKGDINLELSPENAAAAYAKGGAKALSVLTESEYFKGDIAYIKRMAGAGLPMLRKDFILHPLQVEYSASTPASAVLLIVRMLDDAMLRACLFRCLDVGLEAVVEVFDERDLERAQSAGASIIQVNNRDLESLLVDFSLSRRLVARRTPAEFWITASGISGHSELLSLAELGFDAALVGSSLMGGGDPARALSALLKGGASG
ncbi:MAG: indole-3-glycerol-phosphate synthase [Desulfovibrio sp.]|jgi:indole-3-glycerol phosphate synthase|nr:indole-3-glycerol-phosphate synthase [Desulfovibrio sp.]